MTIRYHALVGEPPIHGSPRELRQFQRAAAPREAVTGGSRARKTSSSSGVRSSSRAATSGSASLS